MIRESLQFATLGIESPVKCHKKSSSHSTDESADESGQMKVGKEKSQLCKRFMENGYCPYEKKCKFAHGSHQLRKNHQFNSKYKTKQCGSFKNQQFCIYGDRCNFIHINVPVNLSRQRCIENSPYLDVEMEMIRTVNRKASRLLQIIV